MESEAVNHFNCIYKISFPNNKVYIGQTNDFNRRMGEHKYLKDNKNSLIRKAISKYGWDNVIVEIITENKTYDELNQLEEYYIKEYDSTNTDKGYNITSGGYGCRRSDGHALTYMTGKYGLSVLDDDYIKISNHIRYENNKETINEIRKIKRIENRDEINAKAREYQQRPDIKEKRLKRQKEYYENNKSDLLAKQKEYNNRPDVKEKRLKRQKEYYENNKSDLLAKQKEYNNRLDVKEKRSKRQKEYREKNIEKIKQTQQQYYENNKETISETRKIKRIENRDELNAKQREYRQNNPEKIKEQRQRFMEKHGDRVRAERREKYQANKEKINYERRLKYAMKKALETNKGQMNLETFT